MKQSLWGTLSKVDCMRTRTVWERVHRF